MVESVRGGFRFFFLLIVMVRSEYRVTAHDGCYETLNIKIRSVIDTETRSVQIYRKKDCSCSALAGAGAIGGCPIQRQSVCRWSTTDGE